MPEELTAALPLDFIVLAMQIADKIETDDSGNTRVSGSGEINIEQLKKHFGSK